jgi:hypothetical protein
MGNFADYRKYETGNHSSAAAAVGPACVAVYPIRKFSLPLAPLSVPFFAVVSDKHRTSLCQGT